MKFPFSKRPEPSATGTAKGEESTGAKISEFAAEFRCLWTVSQFFAQNRSASRCAAD